ncbi:MAG: hypothetical protein BZY75_00360 [SAR202 cluster bacterium Io17-Chloro-G7]|nr:MAG: hypothetical protein BZY75_00360 [SAR202 cluster bacterium Io17-Chloro-G7]
MEPRPTTCGPLPAVLQNRQFRLLWYVGTLAETARWMELLVISWLVLQATESPFQLGLVLVFNNLPRPFLSLFTGWIADRASRHLMLIVSQTSNMFTAVALLTLIILGAIEPWHVFVAAFIMGVSRSLEDPSRRTAILDAVGETRLVNATSLEVISNTAGKVVGPLVGGIVIDSMGFTGSYGILLGIHLCNLTLLVTRVRIPNVVQSSVSEPMWTGLGSTLKYALHSPTLVGLFYVTVVMNAMAFPVRQFIPVIGQDHLHVGATLVGLLVASEGIGQLAGAGVMAMTRNFQYLGRVLVFGSIGVLAMTLSFPWLPWYGLALVALIMGGLGQAGFSTMQSTIAMLSAPQEMRGRMMGLLSVFIGAGTPLGTLEMGAIAAVSTQWAISANALAGLALLLPLVFLSPLVKRPVTRQEAVTSL